VNLAQLAFTADLRSVEYLTGSFVLGPFAFSKSRVIACAFAIVITTGAFLFLKLTRLGKAIRAVSQSREVAQVFAALHRDQLEACAADGKRHFVRDRAIGLESVEIPGCETIAEEALGETSRCVEYSRQLFAIVVARVYLQIGVEVSKKTVATDVIPMRVRDKNMA